MGLLKSLALKSNFHFIIKDYKSYSLLFFKLIYLVVCLYFLLFLLKIIYQNQHNIIQGLIGGEIIENKYLIALILIIILTFIVAFAGLVLAVPMTVIMKIICENIPPLKPFAIIMGSSVSD